ncbi:MAG: KTSC domain-containing protein [Sphaerochaetaceae bacterium]|nr:KTSC domain-containing protein [Sphaerochaetaceae bacterium]
MKEELIAIVANLMQQQQLVMDNMDIYSDEELLQFQQEFQQQIVQITQTLDVIESQTAAQETISTQMIPEEADLLWILSGGNPEAFTSYVQTFPSNQLQRYKDNPHALQMLVETLQNRLPQGKPDQQVDGVSKAPLQSSNIYGFQYDSQTGTLRVRFQGDGVYQYEGVPQSVFQIFANGAIPAKTSGQNNYGRWWVGKSPSLGASFHELIKLGGYPYEKIS